MKAKIGEVISYYELITTTCVGETEIFCFEKRSELDRFIRKYDIQGRICEVFTLKKRKKRQ